MNKGMSISRFALGSLKARWKRQLSLVIGIMLAVCFVSSLLLMGQSVYFSYQDRYDHLYGRQDFILRDAELNTNLQQLKDIGLARQVGEARVFGESVTGGVAFGAYDEVGVQLRYRQLLSGRMPEKPGELIIEQGALERLRVKAQLGDSFDIELRTPLGDGKFLEKTDTRRYTLVGILNDQLMMSPNIMEYTSYYGQLPQATTVWGEQAAPGGREVVHYLIDAPFDISENRANRMLKDAGIGGNVLSYGYNLFGDDGGNYAGDDGGNYAAFVMLLAISLGVALVLTACLSIANALNSSLSERARQIGMLRAVGATSRQIRRIYGREAAITAVITAPLAILIAYGAVRLLITLVGPPLQMHFTWWFLPLTLVVSVLVVLLAAAIPLRRASQLSPMQAIRDTSLLRARKRLRVKSQPSYQPARLLAKRHLKLYRSRQAGISLITALNLIIISLAYAGMVYGTAPSQSQSKFDYSLIQNNYPSYDLIDYSHMGRLMTESDLQEIVNLPYMGRIQAAKRLWVNLNVPKVTEYLVGHFDDWDNTKYIGTAQDTAQEQLFAQLERERYLKLLRQQHITGELVTVDMAAMDDASILALQDSVIAGKIDLDAIHAGREVIVTAPREMYLARNDRNPEFGDYVTWLVDDDSHVIKTLPNDSFAVGDKLPLLWLMGTKPANMGIHRSDDDFSQDIDRLDLEVTIGALIAPYAANTSHVFYSELLSVGTVLTSLPGLRALQMDEVSYHSLRMWLSGEPGEAGRELLHSSLNDIAQRSENVVLYDSYFTAQEARRWNTVLWAAVISLILVFFVLCLSMVSNALTNRLKADRSAIGTLRAVGADFRNISRSYRYQVLYMLAAGGLIGILAGPLLTFWLLFWQHGKPVETQRFSIPILLIVLLAFLLVLGLMCMLSLLLRLKSMMRISIVDSIREL